MFRIEILPILCNETLKNYEMTTIETLTKKLKVIKKTSTPVISGGVLITDFTMDECATVKVSLAWYADAINAAYETAIKNLYK